MVIEVLRRIKARRKSVSSDDFIIITQTGKPNTPTNIEHHMKVIYNNAGLTHLKGGVHVLRKTFATGMYEAGARVKEIAAYIGDLEFATEKDYIAIRKKKKLNGKEQYVVMLPVKKEQAS